MMWQVLFAIYIVAVLLSSLLIWAALARAKRADRNIENGPEPLRGFTIRNEEEAFGDMFLK